MWGRVAVLGLAVFTACSHAAPRTATGGALRLQDQAAAQVEALDAVRDAVLGWKGGAMPEWSHADRQELDAALQELDRGIAEARGQANRSAVVPASTGTRGAAPVDAEDTGDVDPRTLYRQQGHRYELIVKASRSWLATEGEESSAEQRHLIEAGLRAAKTSVFRLPALEKQLLRQAS
jgi:hypothetical protein